MPVDGRAVVSVGRKSLRAGSVKSVDIGGVLQVCERMVGGQAKDSHGHVTAPLVSGSAGRHPGVRRQCARRHGGNGYPHAELGRWARLRGSDPAIRCVRASRWCWPSLVGAFGLPQRRQRRRAARVAPGRRRRGDRRPLLPARRQRRHRRAALRHPRPLRASRPAAVAVGPGSSSPPTRTCRGFNLDFLLPVSSVTVDGQRDALRAADRGHELRIDPGPAAGRAGAGRRRRALRRRPAALQPTPARATGWPATREVVAMNEPHMAPWWFPANDHPRDKARIDVQHHRAEGARGGRQRRRSGRTARCGGADARALARGRADGAVPRVLRGRSLHASTRASATGCPGSSRSRKALPTGRAARGDAADEADAGDRALAREGQLGAYPFSTAGGLVTSLEPGFALENQTRPTYPAVGEPDRPPSSTSSRTSGSVTRSRCTTGATSGSTRASATFMEWRWSETARPASAAQRLRRPTTIDASDDVLGPRRSPIVRDPGRLRNGSSTAASTSAAR